MKTREDPKKLVRQRHVGRSTKSVRHRSVDGREVQGIKAFATNAAAAAGGGVVLMRMLSGDY